MIKMTEYAKRRKTLMQKVGPHGVVILPSATEVIRTGDAYYPFRQSSDFYYLTGFDEPDAVLVLLPGNKKGEYILFNRVRDRAHEIWTGPRAGQAGARKDFLADHSFPTDQFQVMLPELLSDREAIHYPLGINPTFDQTIFQSVNHLRGKMRKGIQSPIAFFDVVPTIHEMRLFKSKEEVAVMRKAVDISCKAHERAMRICKPGMFEYQLEAEFTCEFLKQGARSAAYTSIVGSGANTCVLHYIQNQAKIRDGDLVLIDAGCEYQNYASDITRTFPANGRFSEEQRAIYDIVLEAQLAAIRSIKPGASWTKAQEIVVSIITEGLIELGILKGKRDDLIEKQAYFPFYMHHSGHWLGLDVHDAGRYRIDQTWRQLAPSMVFTVEPGIYIPSTLKDVDKRWHHIGIRIEDDVLVTEKGCDVLSQSLPKTIADIEAVMAK